MPGATMDMDQDDFGSPAEWGDQQPEDGVLGEEDAQIQQECLQKFSTPDYIMEPSVFNTLMRYFQAGGSPEEVICLLSDNYTAVAQTINLLAQWLIQTGVEQCRFRKLWKTI